MGAGLTLSELVGAFRRLDPDTQSAVLEDLGHLTETVPWVPNPGPQWDAYYCEADELFYGGEAGGGKTDLGIGLALTSHRRSLILREFNEDARGMGDRLLEILGHRQGWNGQLLRYQEDDRLIKFAGCQYEDDKQRFKGDPHDYIQFDEVGDFSETQYDFICAWNRSAVPGQRCRVLATGNPPTRAKGLWVIKRWGAWLDPAHPKYPTPEGVLRWYTRDGEGNEVEVDGRGPHVIDGREVIARSRTFIRAGLRDNPDLAATPYSATLDALPKELRDAYRDGKFDASLRDQPFQLYPTAWLRAAQARWKPDGHKGLAMTAMAVDPAGGGKDALTIVTRYGGWYAPVIEEKGKHTEDGNIAAGLVVQHRRDECPVVLDTGGGYGGAPRMRLKDNGIDAVAYNGASQSLGKTKDGTLKFLNKRAEAHWRFREELDPAQEGGSAIAIDPNDAELFADLACLTFEVTGKGIKIVEKDKVRELLQRSPGRGDVVVMALSEGNKAAARRLSSVSMGGRAPQVVMRAPVRAPRVMTRR